MACPGALASRYLFNHEFICARSLLVSGVGDTNHNDIDDELNQIYHGENIRTMKHSAEVFDIFCIDARKMEEGDNDDIVITWKIFRYFPIYINHSLVHCM